MTATMGRMPIDRSRVDWGMLGRLIEAGRIDRGWGKEALARKAEVSSDTVRKAEAGLQIQDGKLGAILTALEVSATLPSTRDGEVIRVGDKRAQPQSAEGDVEWVRTSNIPPEVQERIIAKLRAYLEGENDVRNRPSA